MSKRIKLTALGAAIILLIAAALAIIIFSGDEGGDTEKMLAEAEIFLDSRDYDNAIAIYNRIISDEPECAEAYVGLSEAYYAKGRTDKAFEVLEKGAENTDYDEIILGKSAELFPENNLENEDFEEAEGILSEAEIAAVTTAENISEITTITTESETEISETSSETTAEITTTTAGTTTTTAGTTTATAPAVTTTVRTTTAASVTTTKPVTTTTAATTAATVTTTTVKLKEYTVPDFTLMTLDDAYAWCSKHNIILNVAGSENNSEEILSQSPAPGAIVEENSEIIVILN